MKATIHFDGGGQYPGPTVAAATLRYSDQPGVVDEVVKVYPAGEGTNNTAEWGALIHGLAAARRAGATEVEVYGDSKLVVEQVNGRWKVKDPRMRDRCRYAKALLAGFKSWTVEHVRREDNEEADAVGRAAREAA